MIKIDEVIKREAYLQGFLDGIHAYAHTEDGVCYVGTTGRTWRAAKENVKKTWNFKQEMR